MGFETELMTAASRIVRKRVVVREDEMERLDGSRGFEVLKWDTDADVEE